MPQAFTEEELDRLTPEERAAVTADDDESDMQAILDDDGPDDSDDTGTGDKPGADDANKDPAGILTDDDNTPVAAFTAEPVEDYDGKVAEAEAKRVEAFQKMMDGDLSAAEYQAIERDSNATIRELDAKQNEFRVSQSMTEQAQKSAWSNHVGSALEAAKAGGADLMTDPAISLELDRTVRLLAAQVQEDPSMLKGVAQTKPGALVTNGDKWILAEAMKIVAARHDMKLPKPGVKQDPTPSNKTRQPDLSNVPPTLSRVPVSAEASTGGDEFAHLKSLTGAEYEKAVARLTPDQLDRFMA